LDLSAAAQAALVAQAAEARLQERTEAIVKAVGDEATQLNTLLAATETLDDTQFKSVIGAMALSRDIEAKSEKFNEKGVSTKADEAPKQAHFKDYIKTDKE